MRIQQITVLQKRKKKRKRKMNFFTQKLNKKEKNTLLHD